jgi:hypothetical protein
VSLVVSVFGFMGIEKQELSLGWNEMEWNKAESDLGFCG